MILAWAPWLCLAAVAVAGANGFLMAKLIGAIKAYDAKMERLAVFESPQEHRVKDAVIFNRLVDRVLALEADSSKFRGMLTGLSGIEGRIRDSFYKRWKAMGLKAPKPRKNKNAG